MCVSYVSLPPYVCVSVCVRAHPNNLHRRCSFENKLFAKYFSSQSSTQAGVLMLFLYPIFAKPVISQHHGHYKTDLPSHYNIATCSLGCDCEVSCCVLLYTPIEQHPHTGGHT